MDGSRRWRYPPGELYRRAVDVASEKARGKKAERLADIRRQAAGDSEVDVAYSITREHDQVRWVQISVEQTNRVHLIVKVPDNIGGNLIEIAALCSQPGNTLAAVATKILQNVTHRYAVDELQRENTVSGIVEPDLRVVLDRIEAGVLANRVRVHRLGYVIELLAEPASKLVDNVARARATEQPHEVRQEGHPIHQP